MDQARIQARLNRGYGKASRFLGAPFAHYRPIDPTSPLDNQIDTPLAAFDVSSTFTFAAPSKYNNAIYYGLIDATDVLPGDYFISDAGTWFVAGMEPLKPPLCVRCNVTATFYQIGPDTSAPRYYGGDIPAGRTLLIKDLPISELNGGKGERNAAASMPTDSRMQWTQLLLPALPGIVLHQSDRVRDNLERDFVISACELTNLGWRLTAELVEP